MSNFVNKLTLWDMCAAIITFILSGLVAVGFYAMEATDPLLYIVASPVISVIIYILFELAIANRKGCEVNHKGMICGIVGGVLAMAIFGLLIL